LKNSSDSKVRVKTLKIGLDWTTQVLWTGSKLLQNEGNYFQMDTASHQKSLIFINTTTKTSNLPRFNWIWRMTHVLLLGNRLCSWQLCRAAFGHVRLADTTNCTLPVQAEHGLALSVTTVRSSWSSLLLDLRQTVSPVRPFDCPKQGRQKSKTTIP
jgi:hypothetical protein